MKRILLISMITLTFLGAVSQMAQAIEKSTWTTIYYPGGVKTCSQQGSTMMCF